MTALATTPDLNTLLHPYRFTPADKQRMARLLAYAYLTAKYEAYQRAARVAAPYVRVRTAWKPGHHDAQVALQWAISQVEGIASTYETLLQHALEGVLSTEERAFSDFTGKIAQIANAVKDWFTGFLLWKSAQIANVTEGKGDYDGTMAWIDDVQEDAEWVGDDPSIQDLSNLEIEVYPDNASSDFCSDYAGNRYPLEQAGDIPEFPAHPGCIHGVRIVVAGE